MKISSKGRYALEAVLYICLLPEGEYASTRLIAERTGISDGYLEQLFIPLRQAGIVRGIRGSLGGYLPGKALNKITMGDILRAVEGPLEPVACAAPTTLCGKASVCTARHTWVDLYMTIKNCVDSIDLAKMVEFYRAMENPEYTI
ncbi:MAG: Rrf2 family transcriptional regulator [Treponema sp.]|jgi:Rrf2 family protein|nr:Rrf2 family transcriptional regulator [Treponema sp.]